MGLKRQTVLEMQLPPRVRNRQRAQQQSVDDQGRQPEHRRQSRHVDPTYASQAGPAVVPRSPGLCTISAQRIRTRGAS